MGAHAVVRKPQAGKAFAEAEWLAALNTVLGTENDLDRAGTKDLLP